MNDERRPRLENAAAEIAASNRSEPYVEIRIRVGEGPDVVLVAMSYDDEQDLRAWHPDLAQVVEWCAEYGAGVETLHERIGRNVMRRGA